MIVRAKRLGWDEKLTTEQEWDLDPYEYESDDLEGELLEITIPETPEHPAFNLVTVANQEADPKSVEVIEE